jgi:hypothetical protein
LPGIWQVTERKPLLRSRGGREYGDRTEELWSEDLRTPLCSGANWSTGAITGNAPKFGGWVRAKAFGEDYDYYEQQQP